ncbi:hypothetical protein ACFOY4_04095 [Actinomadura syzygii]
MNAVRSLTQADALNGGARDVAIALAWTAGIIVVSAAVAVARFRRI